MEISLLVGLIVAAVLFAILFFLWYAGALARVVVCVGKPVVKNMWVAYKFHQGPYEKCAPYFDEVVKLLPDLPAVGIYYDDPAKVEDSQCRYIVGVVLADGLPEAPYALETMMKKQNYKIIELPAVDYAVKSQFPFRLNLSAMFGAWKVYPALMKFIEARKLSPDPFLEIYVDDVIHYMAPLSKCKEFYVPEVEHKAPATKEQ